MAFLDRDVCLRNHVMGVLVTYTNKGLHYNNMGELADAVTEAVIEGDRKWQQENCCEQIKSMSLDYQDVPQ